MVEITCPVCKCRCLKPKNRVDWNTKRGKQTFCSRSCLGTYSNKKNPERSLGKRDELTPFSWFMPQIKRREHKKGRVLLLTKDDLFEQWQKQRGICPYTGWALVLPWSGNGWILRKADKKVCNPKNIRHASLDRIDCTKGYVKGNVQFTSIMVNLAKSTFSDEELVEMCSAVTKHRG